MHSFYDIEGVYGDIQTIISILIWFMLRFTATVQMTIFFFQRKVEIVLLARQIFICSSKTKQKPMFIGINSVGTWLLAPLQC